MTTTHQPTLADLFDSGNFTWDEAIMRLDDLPDTSYVDVRRDLLASIREVGVLVPVLIATDGDRMEIIDGRHRIAAAREAGEREIPARIADTGLTGGAALTLITNTQRSANVIAEYDAIVRLMESGSSDTEVARLTGIPVGTIRKRLKIASLIPELMTRFRAGEMSAPAAEAAATLPVGRQRKLNADTADVDKIRYRDIHDVRQAASASAAAALPSDIFAPTTPEPAAPAPAPADTAKHTPDDVPGVVDDPRADSGYVPTSHKNGIATIIAVATIAIDGNSTKTELIKALNDIRAIAAQLK